MPIELIAPRPATVIEFGAAHDMEHVRAILACEKRNGFGNTLPSVARSLPYTTGSMLAAAHHVVQHGGVACSPTSGFHHAGWSRCAGFCTFNGLMVTAATLIAEKLVERVAILDCDMHEGDGTQDIIDRDDRRDVDHVTIGRDYHKPEHAEVFLEKLPAMMRSFKFANVLLYQAGADPHVDDPLGGWLTTAQLRRRDEIVFRHAQVMRLPIVWNLAGGYQRLADGTIPKVLEIHDNTMRVFVRAFSSAASPRRNPATPSSSPPGGSFGSTPTRRSPRTRSRATTGRRSSASSARSGGRTSGSRTSRPRSRSAARSAT
jgi:acetoin utilization deacetylase AcuC-like enzyme